MIRCRTRAATTGGSRRSSGRRRWGGARAASVSAARSAVSGVGRAALQRGLRGRGPDRRGRDGPERHADVAPRAPARRAGAVAPGDGHHDLADRLGAPRADLAEADLAARRERDADPQDQLVRGERRPAVAGPEVARPATVRSPRPLPSTNDASSASRTGSVSPGRRGVGDVAAERAAVLDLGRADRRGRLDERREVLAARAPSGGSRCTSSARRATTASPSTVMPRSSSRRHRSSDPLRRLAELAGQRDHQVRAAGDRPRRGRRRSSASASARRARADDGRLDGHRLPVGLPAASAMASTILV